MSDFLVLETAKNWIAAVVYQGQRVLELQEKSAPPDAGDGFLAWAKQRREQPDFTHVEDHFFVTAVSKCVEWLAEAHERDLLEPDLTEAFMIAAGHGKLIRNIREHYLEYLNGGGRQRKKLYAAIAINGSPEPGVVIDASSVIVTDEGRLIGGRLNVQLLMAEADQLYPHVKAKVTAVLQRDAEAERARLGLD